MPILKIYSWCANSIIIKKYCGALHHCLAIADNEHNKQQWSYPNENREVFLYDHSIGDNPSLKSIIKFTESKNSDSYLIKP